MEEKLRGLVDIAVSQDNNAGIQCFDASGLPILAVGKCPGSSSTILSSIYKHAQAITNAEGSKSPVVVIDREKSRIYMAQSNNSITAIHHAVCE